MDWFDLLKYKVYDTNNPFQEIPEALKYRSKEEGLGAIFPVINRIVPKHEEYAIRDKKNATKHRRWAKFLRNYESQVKQMIVDGEANG